MKTMVSFCLALLFCIGAWAQTNTHYELSFDEKEIKVYGLLPNQKQIIEIGITGKFIDSKIDTIKIIPTKNNLPDYLQLKLNQDVIKVDHMRLEENKVIHKYTLFLSISTDSLIKPHRSIQFQLIPFKSGADNGQNNLGANQSITIHFYSHTIEGPLKTYEYLSYIGTNFDLVEGVKADNLFFATNIYSKPTPRQKDFGIYLSLYGNRTMSITENLGVQGITTNLVSVSEDQHYSVVKSVDVTRTIKSDNLGAHFSTLHPIFKSRNNPLKKFKTYFTGSAEFIWQRKYIHTTYGEISFIDTLSQNGSSPNLIVNDLRDQHKTINQYQFNIGPGILFELENDAVSVRVHASSGFTTNFFNVKQEHNDELLYDQKHDVYFAGRAWITEPKTGITIQAEIMNRFINPNPMYVVTLSKAFNLEKLVGFFQPITSR